MSYYHIIINYYQYGKHDLNKFFYSYQIFLHLKMVLYLHNDSNVLALGAGITGDLMALDIVDVFINTKFSGEERHARRVSQIED